MAAGGSEGGTPALCGMGVSPMRLAGILPATPRRGVPDPARRNSRPLPPKPRRGAYTDHPINTTAPPGLILCGTAFTTIEHSKPNLFL